ncbi:MAG: TonB-dependent receptor domain-containing protein [Thermoanaerobaculia bacterium]
MMRRTKTSAMRLAAAALLVLAWGLALLPAAQAQTTGGTLIGRVQDKSGGGALPGANVTATQKETGLSRSTVTESDGTYRLPSLPVGSYTVQVELNGFATVTVENVTINVATQREINVDLSASTVSETINVVAEAPLVQTTPAVGAVVDQKQLENLPLNGRQFANLAILAPGTSLAYNSDPTKPGQLTVALNGGIGRNVNFLVDGGDNTDDTIGGALQNFNLESVQEFNIQTQQYKAEYGRSTGGVLTVVTKTGTNHLSGAAWGFFRKDSFSEETETEKLAGSGKNALDRKQYGASLGGPIVKDKVHFFATYEKTDRKTSYTIVAPVLAENGQSFQVPFKDELLTAKITDNLSPKQYLQVRYGYQKNSDKYSATSLSAPDSLGTITNKYSSILAGHSLQIGADSLNEILFQYTKFNNLISADSNAPYLYFPSGAHRGQNINTPQATNQTKYQYKDDFSFTRTFGGRTNNFKTGINYIHEPTLSGDSTTGTTGQFSYAGDSLNSAITQITINGGFSGYNTPIDQYSVYLQDDLLASDRLTVNVGLRYDYWDGFDLDQRSNPIWQTLSTQTTYNESFLREFQGGRGGVLKNDKNNWAPRIGFTFDTRGDGKQLLRGGWGIYYDFPYTNATILFPALTVQSNFGTIYSFTDTTGQGIHNPNGTLFRPGDPLPPNQLPGLAAGAPTEVASPNIATPYSRQASLGYSWQVNDWLGLNFEGVSIDYRDIPYRFRANPVDPSTKTPTSPAHRRFSQFGNFRLWVGNGKADYDGVNFSFRARATDKLEVLGFYTYSKARGNVLAGADEFRLTDAGYEPAFRGARDVSANPLNPLCGVCVGPLNTDARHRVTLSLVYQAPWGINVSSMYRYRSATPFTYFTAADPNGDGFHFDLLPGDSVNSRRGHAFSQLDLRLSKIFNIGPVGLELIGEVFNLFNEKNPANYTVVFDNAGNPIGTKPTAFAGDLGQGEQRLAQLGVRIRF